VKFTGLVAGRARERAGARRGRERSRARGRLPSAATPVACGDSSRPSTVSLRHRGPRAGPRKLFGANPAARCVRIISTTTSSMLEVVGMWLDDGRARPQGRRARPTALAGCGHACEGDGARPSQAFSGGGPSTTTTDGSAAPEMCGRLRSSWPGRALGAPRRILTSPSGPHTFERGVEDAARDVALRPSSPSRSRTPKRTGPLATLRRGAERAQPRRGRPVATRRNSPSGLFDIRSSEEVGRLTRRHASAATVRFLVRRGRQPP
jgi:hypothetical protein